MKRPINVYEGRLYNNDGKLIDVPNCRASSLPEAAKSMRCEKRDVRCIEANARRTLDERIVDHCARFPPALWRKWWSR